MAIKVEQKFKELKDIVMSAEKYIWPDGREFTVGEIKYKGFFHER